MTVVLQKHIDNSGVDKSAVFGSIMNAIKQMMPKQAMEGSSTNAYDLAIAELEAAKSNDEKAEKNQQKALLQASGYLDDAAKHIKSASVVPVLGGIMKVAVKELEQMGPGKKTPGAKPAMMKPGPGGTPSPSKSGRQQGFKADKSKPDFPDPVNYEKKQRNTEQSMSSQYKVPPHLQEATDKYVKDKSRSQTNMEQGGENALRSGERAKDESRWYINQLTGSRWGDQGPVGPYSKPDPREQKSYSYPSSAEPDQPEVTNAAPAPSGQQGFVADSSRPNIAPMDDETSSVPMLRAMAAGERGKDESRWTLGQLTGSRWGMPGAPWQGAVGPYSKPDPNEQMSYLRPSR